MNINEKTTKISKATTICHKYVLEQLGIYNIPLGLYLCILKLLIAKNIEVLLINCPIGNYVRTEKIKIKFYLYNWFASCSFTDYSGALAKQRERSAANQDLGDWLPWRVCFNSQVKTPNAVSLDCTNLH